MVTLAAASFGASAYAAETDIVGNLTETSDKISSIDMNKNSGEAGKIFNVFYNAAKTKGDSSSRAVYLETKGLQKTSSRTGKELCNAEPSKIRSLASKVPPLKAGNESPASKEGGIPGGAGILAAGAIALGLAGRKKGYFSNYEEDAATVWDYISGGSSSGNNGQNTSGSSHSVSTNTVVNVNNSSGTVTTSTSTDNSCSQGDPGCYGSGYQHQETPAYPRP